MSTTQTESTTAHASIVVDVSPERAFETFTADIGSWWPPDHHILGGELAEMVFEPRVGGRIYDVGTDGSECIWARVLAFEASAATAAAALMAERQLRGRRGDIRDSMIAGIVIAHQATLATRNIRHFDDLPVPVVNPWSD